ncbi:hypothetical protein [Streptomyces sp. NPDC001401]|uniref:hypothetical protein n=1 Tax=Streptomyces sp. NPDC001401 TaxID=3364570 RepID=UPI0036A8F5EB
MPEPGMKYDYRSAPVDLVQRASAIAEVCEQHGTTLPGVAIATQGMRTAEQVERNAELHRRPVPAGLWGHLRAEA